MEDKKEEVKIKVLDNLKVYWGFVKKYKFLFFGVLFLIFLNEMSNILDKYIVKIIFDRSSDFVEGLISQGDLIQLIVFLLAILAFVVVFIDSFVNWMRENLLIKLDTRLTYDLKKRYFSHIVSLDHKFFTTHKTGSLISRMTRGSRAIEGITDTITFQFAPFIFQFSILFVSLIFLNRVSAIIILTIIAIFLIFNLSLQKRRNIDRDKANKAEDREKANIADIFTNIDSVKYFGKEDLIRERFYSLADDSRTTSVKSYNHWRNIILGNTLIIGLGSVSLLYFSFRSFINGDVGIGTLSFVYTTYYSLIRSLFGFTHGFRDLNRLLVDFKDLFEYGQIESNIKDKKGAKEMKIERGEIEFKNIGFAYEEKKIFDNFSLKVPENKTVALVGHSGCGKSSLVKLLYRLYDIQEGSITIDGVNIKDVKHEPLRSEMSIVPQETILFDDTIYNNISFSNPKATRKEVLKAIKFAQLDKLIEKFPQKENTIVGERGIKLSGGEKQRVSIARAILANKRILVLDEATSALDSETESEIQLALKNLMKNRTTIIIAHRLSTIMNADIIVVMKDGEIVQKGKHNELINKQGEYRKLWNLQRGGYLSC